MEEVRGEMNCFPRGRGRGSHEYFNAPRTTNSNVDIYNEDTDKRTVMVRPVSILRKPKDAEQSAESAPRILQGNSVARASSSSRTAKPVSPSVLSRPTSVSSSAPARGSKLIISRSLDKSPVTAQNTSLPQGQKDQRSSQMRAAIKLVGDNMDFMDYVEEYLSDTNTNFKVIGAIGPQGTGKSTLLSMIAGNDHQDMYRHYAFRPASREAVESCRHQSTKISVFVTKSRLILLDCQASFSTAILDEVMRNSRRMLPKTSDYHENRLENQTEIESIELMSFMMQVCDTILLCVDWFLDLDVVRMVRAAEMLRTTPIWSSDSLKFKTNRQINLVLVHQRAKSEDFEPETLRYRCKLLKRLFADCTLKIEGPLNMANMEHEVHAGVPMDVNYMLLADLKPRAKPDSIPINPMVLAQQQDQIQLHSPIVDYELVMRTLRSNVQKLRADDFSTNKAIITEKQWYLLASKLWRSTLTSQDISKYSNILSSLI